MIPITKKPEDYAHMQKVKELRTHAKIKVWVNKKYPEILNVEW